MAAAERNLLCAGKPAAHADKDAGPARRDVVEADTSQALFAANAPGCEEMNLRVVSEVMERAVMQPRFKGYDEAMLRANNELQQVITGIVPFNNSLNKLQKEINAYLQQ